MLRCLKILARLTVRRKRPNGQRPKVRGAGAPKDDAPPRQDGVCWKGAWVRRRGWNFRSKKMRLRREMKGAQSMAWLTCHRPCRERGAAAACRAPGGAADGGPGAGIAELLARCTS